MIPLDGLLWLLLTLGPLLFVQRLLHRGIQAILLLITRRTDISLALFSLLFLPGVALHEVSHFLMARLLGVRTGRFSLLPRPMEDGHLQLGSVETAVVDFVRDALIGAAPLLTGGGFVAYAGLTRLGLVALWDGLSRGDTASLFSAAARLHVQPDFWLWFYLTFAVSSTMLPSPSDRRAWLAMTLAILSLVGLAALAGAGSWMLQNLAPILNQALQALAITLGISIVIHLALLPPVWLLQGLVTQLTGRQVA